VVDIDPSVDTRPTVLAPCESGFAPTDVFLRGENWRGRAERLGPVTFVGWRDLDGGRFGTRTPLVVKLPVLLEPQARADIGIGLPEGVEGGFFGPESVRGTSGVISAPPAAGVSETRVTGCPALPAGGAPEDLPQTAFGLFVTLSQPACAGIRVKVPKQRTIYRTLRLGARTCHLDAVKRRGASCREGGRLADGALMLCRVPSGEERFVVRLAGGGRRTIEVRRPGKIGHWSWAVASPDRRTLLAQWSAECEVPVTYFVAAAGGRPRELLPDVSSIARGWTTDGRAIAYVRADPACGSGPQPGAHLVAVDGSVTRLRGARSTDVPPDLYRSLRPRSVAQVRSALD